MRFTVIRLSSSAMLHTLRLLLVCIFAATALRAEDAREPASPGETIIVSGGVSLWVWEKWKAEPHDNWWANFVRAARIRIEQIKTARPDQPITWLVYRPAYVTRSRQDNRDYTALVASVRDTFHIKLLWFDSAAQLINYLKIGKAHV